MFIRLIADHGQIHKTITSYFRYGFVLLSLYQILFSFRVTPPFRNYVGASDLFSILFLGCKKTKSLFGHASLPPEFIRELGVVLYRSISETYITEINPIVKTR